MSNDQRYLYDMCCAIVDGKVGDGLAEKRIGPMHSARWLTSAGNFKVQMEEQETENSPYQLRN